MADISLVEYTGGLNQHSAPDLINANQSPMMVNITLDQEGSLGSRTGSQLLELFTGTDKVRGMGIQKRSDGTERPFYAVSGALRYYNGTDWDATASGTDQISDGYDVSFTMFKEHLYYISAKDSEYLMKVSDASTPVISEVDSTNHYEGKYLTSGNARLLLMGSHRFPNRVFHSQVDSDKFSIIRATVSSVSGLSVTLTSALFTFSMNGWRIYNITRDEEAWIEAVTSTTVASLTRIASLSSWVNTDELLIMYDFVDIDEAVTAGCSLGEQTPFLIFSKSDAYVYDPSADYVRKMSGFGCVSGKNLQVISGNAIWASYDGVYRYASGMAYPVKISLPLENELTFDKIWNKTTKAGLDASAAWTDSNKYYLSVGNLSGTVDGQTLNDVMLVFNFNQQAWQLRTYTANGLGYCFAEFVDATLGRVKLSGSRDDTALLRWDVINVYTDDDLEDAPIAYTALYRTKHFEYRAFEKSKIILEGHMKGYIGTAIGVKVSLSGSQTYVDWTTTDTTPAGYDWHYMTLAPLYPNTCKSISLEFSGTGKWYIYNVGLDLKTEETSNLNRV